MNVWEFDPAKNTFRGRTATGIDDVGDLFKYRRLEKTHWFGLCPIWTLLLHDVKNDYNVYIGHRSPVDGDINYPATRMLVDCDQFSSAGALTGSSDFLTFCVRGKVLFYQFSNKEKKMVPYDWKTFCAHWPLFFRVGRLPYMELQKEVADPLSTWIAVNRGDRAMLKTLCFCLKRPVQAGSKDVICGALVAMVLRRMDKQKWDTIELGAILKK